MGLLKTQDTLSFHFILPNAQEALAFPAPILPVLGFRGFLSQPCAELHTQPAETPLLGTQWAGRVHSGTDPPQ